MEHGGPVAGGWLARFLRARGPVGSPLSAVALAPTLPASLSGAPAAAAFRSLDEFTLMKPAQAKRRPEFAAQLRRLYEAEDETLRAAAANTLTTENLRVSFSALKKVATFLSTLACIHWPKK